MNVLGRIFLKSRKDSRKDVKTERRKDVKTEFFVRCRRTYVLKNMYNIVEHRWVVVKSSDTNYEKEHRVSY